MDAQRGGFLRKRRWEWGLAIGIGALILMAGAVLTLAKRGALSRAFQPSVAAGPIPGITVENDMPSRGEAMPIVTSLRSDSQAARDGLEVGDHISAIDGHSSPDVAALRAIVAGEPAGHPVALHIRRGNAVWTVALDRPEPADTRKAHGTSHDPQDPAG